MNLQFYFKLITIALSLFMTNLMEYQTLQVRLRLVCEIPVCQQAQCLLHLFQSNLLKKYHVLLATDNVPRSVNYL